MLALALAGLAFFYVVSAPVAEGAVPHPPPHAVHPPAHVVVHPPARAARHLPPPAVVVVRRPVETTTVIRTVEELPAVEAPAATAQPSAENATPPKTYKVVSVGKDMTVTLDIDGKETPVRMLGVGVPAAPEGRTGPPPMSVRFLRNLLDGEFVSLAYDPDLGDKDEAGNLAAYLYRAPEGLLVNLEVIRQGFGVTAADYEFGYQKTFKIYEARAQADDRGIWGLVKRGGPPPKAKPNP